MDAQSKLKPGPRKGELAQLRTDLANYIDETDYLRKRYMSLVGQRTQLYQRVTNFNNMSTWAKLLFILKGGHV